ncbi:ABC transporter permease [Cesiribacter andamanensis]|uniref:ABC-type transport system involved in multi-copper enzyme maturation, permease component n=1 Tax=Cesiribacter andamanensis AMV16 TaxID=1279009 RepID=M7NYD1_9BACT|nr:ABC transporter permease subunit [Cesiribacter andamanensis]EMR03389.1 ABC-type transport system involved in multi-copper enzyme maturation, permease component [Cesiribacter andamanensis AMV16]
MEKVIKYVLYDILRNRIVIGYTGFLLLMSLGLFQLENDPSKAVLSLLNVVLLVVPLISIIFATIHFYNSQEFMELLVAQPINRQKIFYSEYLGVALSLAAAFAIGVGVPVLLFGGSGPAGVYLISAGIFLTFIFVSLAFLASVLTRDKAKGIGLALLLWFYFSLLYDGLVMMVLFYFSEYPLENVSLGMLSLNPIDLGRVLVLLQIDVSALMGYTGALYKSLFSNFTGVLYAGLLMLAWVLLPLMLAKRIFIRKDL